MEVIAQLSVHMIGLITSTPIDRSQLFVSVSHFSTFDTVICYISNFTFVSCWHLYRQIIEVVFKTEWKVYNRIWHNRATVFTTQSRLNVYMHALPLLRDARSCDTRTEKKPYSVCPTGAFFWEKAKEQRRKNFGPCLKCELCA